MSNCRSGSLNVSLWKFSVQSVFIHRVLVKRFSRWRFCYGNVKLVLFLWFHYYYTDVILMSFWKLSIDKGFCLFAYVWKTCKASLLNCLLCWLSRFLHVYTYHYMNSSLKSIFNVWKTFKQTCNVMHVMARSLNSNTILEVIV